MFCINPAVFIGPVQVRTGIRFFGNQLVNICIQCAGNGFRNRPGIAAAGKITRVLSAAGTGVSGWAGASGASLLTAAAALLEEAEVSLLESEALSAGVLSEEALTEELLLDEAEDDETGGCAWEDEACWPHPAAASITRAARKPMIFFIRNAPFQKGLLFFMVLL